MFRLCFGSILLIGLAIVLHGPFIGHDEQHQTFAQPSEDRANNPFETVAPDSETAPVESQEPVAVPSANEPDGVIVAQDARIRLDQEVVLASDRPGILKIVAAEEGDRVTAGSQIARLRDEVAVAALNVARKSAENDVEIRYAQAAAAVSEAEYERSLEANERGRKIQLSADLIVAVELERLRLAAERARLQVLNAQIEQEVAILTAEEKAAELGTYQISTPIDGIVAEVLKHPGEAVQQGDPILRVVRTDTVKIEAYVTVAESFQVQAGDAVTVRLNGETIPNLPAELASRTFQGEIVFVNPTAVPISNVVSVLAEVRNDDNFLRGGLPAIMEITPGSAGATGGGESPGEETNP